VSPPAFLGVAAIDLNMDVMYDILGERAKVTELLQDHISESKCPTFKILNETDRDRLRIHLGGEKAVCGDINFTQFDHNETCDEDSLPEGEELFGEKINGKPIQHPLVNLPLPFFSRI
jgi:hypothetical protein